MGDLGFWWLVEGNLGGWRGTINIRFNGGCSAINLEIGDFPTCLIPLCRPPLWVDRYSDWRSFFRHGDCCPMLTHCIEYREGFCVQRKSYQQWLSAITYMRLNGVNSVVPNRIYIYYYSFAVRLPANRKQRYQTGPIPAIRPIPSEEWHIFQAEQDTFCFGWVWCFILNEYNKYIPLKNPATMEFFFFFVISQVSQAMWPGFFDVVFLKARQEEQVRLVPLLFRFRFWCRWVLVI